MIDLEKHHAQRIDEIATASGATPTDILAQAITELGPMFTHGALAGWLWTQRVQLGLERRSAHRDTLKQINAWQTIEAGWRDSEAQLEVTELDP